LAEEQAWNSVLTELIFVGKIAREFQVLGQPVEMRTLDAETEAQIRVRCSGLDLLARESRLRILTVAHSLTRVGNYTFESQDEKLKFVGQLKDRVLDIFVGHYQALLQAEAEAVKDLEEQIKKSAAPPSPGASGEFSDASPTS